jgi:exosome complex RNA-binding protein Csl4
MNTENLKKVGSSFTKHLTLPIVAATTALAALSVKSMQTADEIADNASKVYLSVEAYQEWGYVAKILAVDSNNLQKALVRTNSILGEVSQGGDKYASTLMKMGLSSDSLIGKSTDEAFELIRDSLSKVEDQAERTVLANEIFGEKLGTELAQILQSTSSEINTLRNQARELGIVTTEQADVAGKFTDSIDNLKQSFSSLGVSIAMEVVPVLQKMMDLIQSKVVPAIRNLVNWWSNLSNGMKTTFGILLGVLAAIGPVITIVLKLIPMIKTLQGVMSGGAILKFFQGFAIGKIALVGLIATLAITKREV